MTTPIDRELAPTSNGVRLPSLGSPELSTDFLGRVKEIIETLLGRRGGSNWDRAVTFRDLYQLGVNVGNAAGFGGAFTIEAPNTIAPAGLLTGQAQQFDMALRKSAAYKELQRGIGSDADLAMFPDEFRQLLSQSLASVARDRQADIQTVTRKIQTSAISVASRLDEITAALEQTAAGVRKFDGAYADDLRALATSITQVTASIGDIGDVTVEEKFLAQADINSGLLGQWSIKIQTGTAANPIIAGIALSSEGPTADQTTSSLVFMADKFGFYTQNGTVMPFGIDGATNRIYLNGQLIVNAGGQTLDGMLSGTVNYVGSFTAAPAVANYKANDIYKNLTDGNTYILQVANNVKSWALWLAKGDPGGAGPAGPTGPRGYTGDRGNLDIAVSGYAGYSGQSDSGATNIFINATSLAPVNRDRMTLYSGSTSETRFYNNGTWLTIAAYINGNMIVSGTLSASQISTGFLSADRISGGTITGSSINIKGNFRVLEDGYCSMFVPNFYRATITNGDAPGFPALIANTASSTQPAIKCNGDLLPGGANLGSSTYPWTGIYSQSAVVVTSDARLKCDIEDSDLGLDFIKQLRPVSYRLVQNGVTREPGEELTGPWRENEPPQYDVTVTPTAGERRHYGLIAQEVKEVLGDQDAAIWTLADKSDPDSGQALRYEELIAPMLKAIQELSATVEAQQRQIADLTAAIGTR